MKKTGFRDTTFDAKIDTGERKIVYKPRGNMVEWFASKVKESVLTGPAGTGKSRCALEKCNLLLSKKPGIRAIMLRKTRTSMTHSCIKTYTEEVLDPLEGVDFHATDQEFRYPNGSTFAVAGLDDPTKLMSAQYDIVYINEMTELEYDDWQLVKIRNRNMRLRDANGDTYQLRFGDTNPGPPGHWIYQEHVAGRLPFIETYHKDNPVYWDEEKQEWTPQGKEYVLGTLAGLTGTARERYYLGKWVSAEGAVYEEFDRRIHVIKPFPIPSEWKIYWVIDFGYTNPFVWQCWAEDPDGRLYLVHEIYMTHRIVEDHCRMIRQFWMGKRIPDAIICDHDAEDRATFTRHVGLPTAPAYKLVNAGINNVKKRLKVEGDGKPRLYIFETALIHGPDPRLVKDRKPTRTEAEFDRYVWDTEIKKSDQFDVPMKKHDHGMDAMRYACAFVDSLAIDPAEPAGVVNLAHDFDDNAYLHDPEYERISPI